MPPVSVTEPSSDALALSFPLPSHDGLRFLAERPPCLFHPGHVMPDLSARGLSHWQVQRVLREIENGLDGPLRLSQLATAVRLSSSYFCRAFKASFGSSPHGFIMRMRIERAKRLMLNGIPLAEISVSCGLSDQAHLSRVFRKLVGETPGRWRRRHFQPSSCGSSVSMTY